ncbi:tellurite resistance TerB family protein [Paraglaciecola aestuariivivens]
MLSSIQDWFARQFEQTEVSTQHSIELATAVLLYEVMRSDHKLEETEHQSYLQQLTQHFQLTQQELNELTELTQNQSDTAADYQQFTRVINELYGPAEKRAVLDSLWAVAYADHTLSPEEEYTIRKIADLLYIPHSQFIQSKLSVKPD